MLSTTVLSSVHCDTETEMSGMLRHNGIYASIMKRSQGFFSFYYRAMWF